MNEALRERFIGQQPVVSSEFNDQPSYEVFGKIVYPMFLQERATAQHNLFDADITWQLVRPEETIDLEAQHLARRETPKGVVAPVKALVIDTFDRDMESMRLSELRTDIAALRPSGWGQETPTPSTGNSGWGNS